MSGPRRGFTGGKKAKDAKGTMKRLLGYIARGNQLRLAVVFILLRTRKSKSVGGVKGKAAKKTQAKKTTKAVRV